MDINKCVLVWVFVRRAIEFTFVYLSVYVLLQEGIYSVAAGTASRKLQKLAGGYLRAALWYNAE